MATTKGPKPKTSRCSNCGAGRVEIAGPALLRALKDLLAALHAGNLNAVEIAEADKAVAWAEGRGT